MDWVGGRGGVGLDERFRGRGILFAEEDRRERALMYELAPRIERDRVHSLFLSLYFTHSSEIEKRERGREVFAGKGMKYDFICRYCHGAPRDSRGLPVPLPSTVQFASTG